jgi:adenosylhomocysteine nucleosidase
MWQSLVRNWLIGAAQKTLREKAGEAVSSASDPAATAQPSMPPVPESTTCHVGIVCALSIEAAELVDRLAGVIDTRGAGFVAHEGGYKGKRIVVVESGIGRQAATKAAQALIRGHQPRWMISTGFGGGLDPRVGVGDIVLVDEIVDVAGRAFRIDFRLDSAWQQQEHLHVGRLLTVDRIVREPAEKRGLGERLRALALDMESIAVAEVCRDEKVRFMAVRAISDSVDRQLPKDVEYLLSRRSTVGQIGAAAGAIFRRPASVKDMWQLKEDALVASQRLATFLTSLIEQLP